MNWYKNIKFGSAYKKNSEMSLEQLEVFQFPQEKLAQTYDEIMNNPEEYSDTNDSGHFDAKRYFSIGQNNGNEGNNFCWIYDGHNLYVKKGGTHNMNFPGIYSDNSFTGYRGWYDPSQKLISVITPREVSNVDPALEASSLPTKLRVVLSDNFGTDNKIVVF